MPRTDMSPAEKVKLLDKIKEHPENTSVRALAELLNVPRATIGRLRRLEAEIRLQAQTETSQKRRRDGKNPHVEQALLEWFHVATGRGDNVSGPILLKTASELALKLGYTDFKATDGWLSRWKKRRNVNFKKIPTAKTAADDWKAAIPPEILERFPPDNIYSADEAGIHYRATPDGSLRFRKDEMDSARATILCCANMMGSDKRKLLMIAKSENPCLFNISQAKLPIEYLANAHGWISSQIFTEWLVNWDKELQRLSRSVALVVNDCAAHPKIDYLQNITIVFLPSNMVPPMAMGITKDIKDRYKSKVVEFVVNKIDEKCVEGTATAADIGCQIDLDQVMNFLADSWREVSPRVIQKCFSKCGFKIDEEMDARTDEEFHVPDLSRVRNGDDFRNVDNDLKCYDENENSEETEECADGQDESAMKECVVEGRICETGCKGEECRMDKHPVEKGLSSMDEGVRNKTGSRMGGLELPEVSVEEAIACVEKLKRFFTQKGNDNSPVSALETCYDYVANVTNKRARHSP